MSVQAEEEQALMSRGRSVGGEAAAAAGAPDASIGRALGGLDSARLRDEYVNQGSFLYLAEFLPAEATQKLIDAANALMPEVNRNFIPGHKAGGSVSRHTIDRLQPYIAELYRSPKLIAWLEKITGDKLQLSPEDDPHAYALYYYTRAGDHIGWHYDTSYYDGRRYTVLLGVIDDSSCILDYELHTRDPNKADEAGAVQYPPGALVLFDGDKLRHRVTASREGEVRVSLTFEYVTNPNMRPWRRFISNMKDAIAYFGFRQVFRKALQSATGGARKIGERV
ncbi:alkylated DNA repair dioxygenase AlkB [Paraburkholderia bannensis]|uniref:Alkylated DNA repair dioxygenase AlkB n=1 Tax=Paraburkholderia bannensis TaxID=765414 RepID=A0A7W9WRU4_9BURK|nr:MULTISPECIES: 2OG-Fe(II) oxygenase [Paraburkholderia]MBB3258547.1 alkylated DNA repair dioxygenase AlkB [Paraburkholderia sp. WP4_3_2]MBB6103560.1 alkylated DNA repair dioxygenase AlkB [Paraburkholderia bannensis]